jgi:hypothetical protein
MLVRDRGQLPGGGDRSPWNSRCSPEVRAGHQLDGVGEEHGGADATRSCGYLLNMIECKLWLE